MRYERRYVFSLGADAWYNLGIAHGWAEAAGDSGLPTRDASSSASYLE